MFILWRRHWEQLAEVLVETNEKKAPGRVAWGAAGGGVRGSAPGREAGGGGGAEVPLAGHPPLPPGAPERPCDTTGGGGLLPPLSRRRAHALCGGVARAVRILFRLIQPFASKLIAVEDNLGY